MSLKKIRERNSQQFLDDLKSVRDIMVFTEKTCSHLHVSKREILREAESGKIHYYLTDKIFIQKRMVMVII